MNYNNILQLLKKNNLFTIIDIYKKYNFFNNNALIENSNIKWIKFNCFSSYINYYRYFKNGVFYPKIGLLKYNKMTSFDNKYNLIGYFDILEQFFKKCNINENDCLNISEVYEKNSLFIENKDNLFFLTILHFKIESTKELTHRIIFLLIYKLNNLTSSNNYLELIYYQYLGCISDSFYETKLTNNTFHKIRNKVDNSIIYETYGCNFNMNSTYYTIINKLDIIIDKYNNNLIKLKNKILYYNIYFNSLHQQSLNDKYCISGSFQNFYKRRLKNIYPKYFEVVKNRIEKYIIQCITSPNKCNSSNKNRSINRQNQIFKGNNYQLNIVWVEKFHNKIFIIITYNLECEGFYNKMYIYYTFHDVKRKFDLLSEKYKIFEKNKLYKYIRPLISYYDSRKKSINFLHIHSNPPFQKIFALKNVDKYLNKFKINIIKYEFIKENLYIFIEILTSENHVSEYTKWIYVYKFIKKENQENIFKPYFMNLRNKFNLFEKNLYYEITNYLASYN